MENEIALHSEEAAYKVASELLNHGNYVVMISREEDLWIINYHYSHLCDRNDVVFMRRDEYEEELWKIGSEDISES